MSISIVYLTSRAEPKLEWFSRSLHLQAQYLGVVPEVVVVDTRLWYDPTRREYFKKVTDGCTGTWKHTPPKDTVWQGPRRLTTEDYFCASSARNTGIMHSSHDYILFVDDLSVLLPGWLENAIHAAQNRYVVCGAYKKVKNLHVEDGRLISFDPFPLGVDSRWGSGSDKGIVPWSGGGLYGCSFGVPTSALLEVNGLDEHLDGQGWEDCDLGIRLERAGSKFFYNRNMCTYESEELHYQTPIMKRSIKHAQGRANAHEICAKNLLTSKRKLPVQNLYSLAEERDKVLSGGDPTFFPHPTNHWYDNQPLTEL